LTNECEITDSFLPVNSQLYGSMIRSQCTNDTYLMMMTMTSWYIYDRQDG